MKNNINITYNSDGTVDRVSAKDINIFVIEQLDDGVFYLAIQNHEGKEYLMLDIDKRGLTVNEHFKNGASKISNKN